VPDYVGYLAHVITNLTQETEHIRTISGYLLKNHAWLLTKAPPEVATFAKAAILQAFQDPQPMIRKVAGQVIVSFLRVLDPKNWTEALTHLVHALDSPQLEQQEASKHLLTTWERLAKRSSRAPLTPWRKHAKTSRAS
jgi:transportin-1